MFTQNKPAEQKPFSFGNSTTQNAGASIFGQSTTAPPQTTGMFGSTTNPPRQGAGLGVFGGSVFGQSTQQQQQAQQQTQRPLDQTLRFGNSTTEQQQQQHAQSMWEEGRGMGVYRSIPAQMNIITDKWNVVSISSPLRTYLYQHVADEKEALMYRPNPNEEDENKWDEAVSNRPGPTWVPLLIRGFFQLGRKAQQQAEAMHRCNMILQEINNSLDMQLDMHRQTIAARLSEAKRRQQAISRRTLALAVKVQNLRNKGYVMDNAEEELKAKLEKLERDVFDPGLEAREQEIWARMLGVRERAKRLKTEMDKIAPVANAQEPTLDENTIKSAKFVLEDFQKQLKFILAEAETIQKEYEEWEKLVKGRPR